MRKEIYRAACSATVSRFRSMASTEGDGLDFERAMESVREEFERQIQDLCPLKRFLSEGDIYDIVFDGWEDCGEYVREECRKVLFAMKKDRSAEQIRRVTAEAVIVPAIRRIGYPYTLQYQKNRLKVLLLTGHGKIFEFFIKYRDFSNKEITDRIPERTREAVKYIQMYGPQLRLKGGNAGIVWDSPDVSGETISDNI